MSDHNVHSVSGGSVFEPNCGVMYLRTRLPSEDVCQAARLGCLINFQLLLFNAGPVDPGYALPLQTL